MAIDGILITTGGRLLTIHGHGFRGDGHLSIGKMRLFIVSKPSFLMMGEKLELVSCKTVTRSANSDIAVENVKVQKF